MRKELLQALKATPSQNIQKWSLRSDEEEKAWQSPTCCTCPLQTVAVSSQPDITKSKSRLSSYSGLLSLSTLAMLQKVVGLSVWCRLYAVLFHQQLFLFGLSPSWHWGGLLSVSTVWRPSWLLLHPLWVSLGWTFCFSVYMLLGAKSTNLLRRCLSVVWSKTWWVCCSTNLNFDQVSLSLHTNKTKQTNVSYFLLNVSIPG